MKRQSIEEYAKERIKMNEQAYIYITNTTFANKHNLDMNESYKVHAIFGDSVGIKNENSSGPDELIVVPKQCYAYEPEDLHTFKDYFDAIHGKKEDDPVNHPSHYETGKYECIDVMEEALGRDQVKGFCLCNSFKYLYRSKRKNGLEDLKKAQWYLNKLIEMEEEDNEDETD